MKIRDRFDYFLQATLEEFFDIEKNFLGIRQDKDKD